MGVFIPPCHSLIRTILHIFAPINPSLSKRGIYFPLIPTIFITSIRAGVEIRNRNVGNAAELRAAFFCYHLVMKINKNMLTFVPPIGN